MKKNLVYSTPNIPNESRFVPQRDFDEVQERGELRNDETSDRPIFATQLDQRGHQCIHLETPAEQLKKGNSGCWNNKTLGPHLEGSMSSDIRDMYPRVLDCCREITQFPPDYFDETA